ncbi:MAG: hypothetical protein UY04_C0049G0003 [Parcubacteria group bacterium GW2011_GWA2_47_7]|nr:MAG: hypothetical protein UY04_C0049G0003 [Parcubacteria group bacterium GW2011_GWA2_47_7]
MTDSTISKKTFSELIQDAIQREKHTGIEFCTSCAKDMNFSSKLHVDHPARYVGGAYYVDGSGQICAACAAKESDNKK